MDDLICAYRQVLQSRWGSLQKLVGVLFVAVCMLWAAIWERKVPSGVWREILDVTISSKYGRITSLGFILCFFWSMLWAVVYQAKVNAYKASFVNPEKVRTEMEKVVKFDSEQWFAAEISQELSEPGVRHYENNRRHIYAWNTHKWLILFSTGGSMIVKKNRVRSVAVKSILWNSVRSISIDLGSERFSLRCGGDEYVDVLKVLKGDMGAGSDKRGF